MSQFIQNKKNIKTILPKFYDVLSIPSNPEDLFTLLYPIGKGAYGQVFKAIHNETKAIYAIKILDYSKNNDSKNNNVINNNYNSIQQETSLMKLLTDCKYIIKYYGSYFSRKSNKLWLVLEYCSCGSLLDLMFSIERTFTEYEIASIISMVLKGLDYIHKKNLIHRDIKGANILINEEGIAKIADFGVGVHLINEINRKSKKGSPYWMSPQVALNSEYNEKTDIWSLGITCIEMINGDPPNSQLKPRYAIKKIGEDPPSAEKLLVGKNYSTEFKDFISKCLEIDEIKRPNAKELLKHCFIKKYNKGKEFIKNLVKNHIKDVEKFREQTLQKYNKNNESESNQQIEVEFNYNINKNNSDEKYKRNEGGIINNIYHKEIILNSPSFFKHAKDKNKRKIKLERRNMRNEKILDYGNISAKLTKRKDIFKDEFQDHIKDEEQKFQTLITHESLEVNKNEIKNNIIPDYINFIEKDKFIFDDLKYLELAAKEFINKKDENKIIEKASEDSNKKNFKNELIVPTNFTYTKPHLIRNKNNKKIYLSQKISKNSKINSMETNISSDINDNIFPVSKEFDDTINNKKPLKMFFHENNISTINSKNEIDQNKENICDLDDEGIINKIYNNGKFNFKIIDYYKKLKEKK